ncbi:Hypothetical predicted protein [Xyrichtys novacula]|uniref:Uncharacterized protein n=1 Tax=Xyrichtys novacula TaxID=13765 RepID=A0AAV1FFN6_XYRNO|nr:Hypothetical predicted protein [Xyrichtys novacula]
MTSFSRSAAENRTTTAVNNGDLLLLLRVRMMILLMMMKRRRMVTAQRERPVCVSSALRSKPVQQQVVYLQSDSAERSSNPDLRSESAEDLRENRTN